VDSPRALYARPRTVFVAGFVGTANVLDGPLARRVTGGDRPVSVRPEQIRFGAPAGDQVGLEGRVVDVQFHGPVSRYEVQVEGAVLTVSLPSEQGGGGGGGGDGSRPRAGDPVRLAWPRGAMVPLEQVAPGS